MAEARSVAHLGEDFKAGARVGLSIDDEGLHIRTNVTIPPPREAWRRFRSWLRGLYRAVVYSFFPFGPAVVMGFTALVVAGVVASPRSSWVRSGPLANFVWTVSQYLPWLPGTSLAVRVGVLAAWVAVVALFLASFTQRIALKLLLRDKTFMYQARAPTLWVRVWFMLVKALTYRKPLMYSFQTSLPAQPVPRLRDTVEKYLESAELLQTPEEFERTQALAKQFLEAEGPQLQWYLNLKSWIAPHYMTDWWEKYVYLRGRSSIAINSNYYVLDSGRWTPTTVQTARAAIVVYSMMRYKEKLEAEEHEPTMLGDGAVPLCMWQYERMFATSRIPGRECDEIKHWDTADIRHIVVYCRGSFFKVNVYRRDGTLRTPVELEAAFQNIQRQAAERAERLSPAEAALPALTGENRTKWAEVRENHLLEGFNNRRSLTAIESALLYVVLSDKTFDTEDWTSRGKYLIGSDPTTPDVWFDKSVNLIVTADGKSGLNCEHAWADAPVAAHLFEVAMIVGEEKLNPYDEDGHVRANGWPAAAPDACGSRSGSDDTVQLLQWNLSRECEAAITGAVESLRTLISNLDLRVVAHTAYGKDFVKKCKVSPDAYIQLAMQLAYHRDQGRFDATYESSMTRLFLHGRTETVRPVTRESCQFVRTMEDSGATAKQKLEALRKAAGRHVRGYTDAMCGGGIDRHLFALYVVSVGKSIDSPFLKSALAVPWKLSTSQQPQQQTSLWDIKDPKNARRISPGGGFGPVSEDGYGVSYMVSGEREIFFHVSSIKSTTGTDSGRFAGRIFAALTEMKEVLSVALSEEDAAAGRVGRARGRRPRSEGCGVG